MTLDEMRNLQVGDSVIHHVSGNRWKVKKIRVGKNDPDTISLTLVRGYRMMKLDASGAYLLSVDDEGRWG